MLNARSSSSSPGGMGMIMTEIIPMTDSANRTSVYWATLSRNEFMHALRRFYNLHNILTFQWFSQFWASLLVVCPAGYGRPYQSVSATVRRVRRKT